MILMKANVYALDGRALKEIDLPEIFSEKIDTDIIKRAVLAIQSARLQPKGTYLLAGRDNSAQYRGARYLPAMERSINVGHARLPRLKNRRHLLQGNVARVPQARGGVRAHPPKTEKQISERINKKEKRIALRSAVAATSNLELVKGRGHKFGEVSLPVIVEDKIEQLAKTKEVMAVLKKLNVASDIERAKKRRIMRSGKGRKRGRKYKKAKSILMITKEKGKLFQAARNLEGVEVIPVKELNAELLAPGAVPGRLTLWTESAIKQL